jgi:hypothetical protein
MFRCYAASMAKRKVPASFKENMARVKAGKAPLAGKAKKK